MFEHRQNQLESLLKENLEFRRVYNKHQELEKRVFEVDSTSGPIDEIALHQMKKEKLLCKDHLERMMS